MLRKFDLVSEFDGLVLSCAIFKADREKGIIQFSHGMVEHKERYYPFMEFLAKRGYSCVIHDHRGHGRSIDNEKDLGYFYTENEYAIVEDLVQVNKWISHKYKGMPIYLFAHSMGTLVARVFLQNYDKNVDKVVLCGPPTESKNIDLGIILAKINSKIFGSRNRSNFLQSMTFRGYKVFDNVENDWICSDKYIVNKYNRDPLCNYRFTTNGFLNLYGLMKKAFTREKYLCKNPDLPILLIGGKDDPVIQNEKKFLELKQFLESIGYKYVYSRLYDDKRHELINEVNKELIWLDILRFFEHSFIPLDGKNSLV